jgi:hypothetical protein
MPHRHVQEKSASERSEWTQPDQYARAAMPWRKQLCAAAAAAAAEAEAAKVDAQSAENATL